MMVSVIVPVYNVADYLPKCVDSLLVQTYNDIEILLIDDGSTDGSGEIADQYAKQDNRIRTFHQPNGGISAARNKGLEVMRGDYVMFVDGDDYVSKDFCKVALDLAIENEVDIVSFGYFTFLDQGVELERRATREPRLLNKEQAIQELIRRRDVLYNYVWNKIFKSRLFDGVRYTEGLSFEDVAIIHLIFDKATTGIYLSNQVLYYYRKARPCSITSSLRSPVAIHDRLSGELERLEFVKEHYPALERYQFAPIVELCFQGLTLLPSGHDDRKEIKRFLDSNKEKCIAATNGIRKIRMMAYYYMKPLSYMATLYVKKHYYVNNK